LMLNCTSPCTNPLSRLQSLNIIHRGCTFHFSYPYWTITSIYWRKYSEFGHRDCAQIDMNSDKNITQWLLSSFQPSYSILIDYRPYSKSSLTLTLNEWRFNLSFSWVLMLFSNSWRVSSHRVRYETSPPAIQKQH
jgi:hypothetical protein